MQNVFSNVDLFHHWAHNPLDDIRNAGHTLYTSEGVLYSYGSHYKMAKQFRLSSGPDLEGQTTVTLFNENTYSPTTGKQRGQAMSACSHHVIIQVPDVDPQNQSDHDDNMIWLHEQIQSALQTYERARKRKIAAAEWAVRARQNLLDYAGYFGLELGELLGVDLPGIDALLAEAEQSEREAREAREAVLSVDLKAWQQCKCEKVPMGSHTVAPRLRVHNNELQTSHGIRVALTDDTIRELMQVWRTVQMYRSGAYGECTYKMFPAKVSSWCMDKLEEIDGRVYLIAGCHRMEYHQIRRVARMMGFPLTPNGAKLELVA